MQSIIIFLYGNIKNVNFLSSRKVYMQVQSLYIINGIKIFGRIIEFQWD